MTDEPDNLVLIHLRRLHEKVDRIGDDIHDLSVRTANVDENLAGVYRRLDRIDTRLDRIERRLDLADAPRG